MVIVAVGALTVGITALPSEPPDDGGPVDVVDPGPHASIRSSTRGEVAVALAPPVAGGTPHDPGGQARAAAVMEEEIARTTGPPPASTESVIGADQRVWLRERTDRYPNAAIGRLDFRQGGTSYWCTGTLIDADTVLTAGHCVHDGLGGDDGWSTAVRFIPGAEGNRAPFGSCGSRELLALPGWVGSGSEYQDLGLVQLDCRIGEVTGWYGFRSAPGRRGLRNVVSHLRGYPGDKVWSTLWTMRDRIRVSQRQMAFYAADTYGGQSGSPVFNFRACNGVAGPCILAVHAYGTHPGGPHGRYNHGPRLNEERVALIATLAAA